MTVDLEPYAWDVLTLCVQGRTLDATANLRPPWRGRAERFLREHPLGRRIVQLGVQVCHAEEQARAAACEVFARYGDTVALQASRGSWDRVVALKDEGMSLVQMALPELTAAMEHP